MDSASSTYGKCDKVDCKTCPLVNKCNSRPADITKSDTDEWDFIQRFNLHSIKDWNREHRK